MYNPEKTVCFNVVVNDKVVTEHIADKKLHYIEATPGDNFVLEVNLFKPILKALVSLTVNGLSAVTGKPSLSIHSQSVGCVVRSTIPCPLVVEGWSPGQVPTKDVIGNQESTFFKFWPFGLSPDGNNMGVLTCSVYLEQPHSTSLSVPEEKTLFNPESKPSYVMTIYYVTRDFLVMRRLVSDENQVISVEK